MIVKAQLENGWKLYEAVEVTWTTHNEEVAFQSDIDLEFIESVTMPAERSKMAIEILTHNKARKVIVTSGDVYILNDNGKTVERI